MRQTPIKQSLVKPALIMGVEPVPFFVIILLSGGMLLAWTWEGVIGAVLLFCLTYFPLRRVTETDPLFVKVRRRWLSARDWYAPVRRS